MEPTQRAALAAGSSADYSLMVLVPLDMASHLRAAIQARAGKHSAAAPATQTQKLYYFARSPF